MHVALRLCSRRDPERERDAYRQPRAARQRYAAFVRHSADNCVILS